MYEGICNTGVMKGLCYAWFGVGCGGKVVGRVTTDYSGSDFGEDEVEGGMVQELGAVLYR